MPNNNNDFEDTNMLPSTAQKILEGLLNDDGTVYNDQHRISAAAAALIANEIKELRFAIDRLIAVVKSKG